MVKPYSIGYITNLQREFYEDRVIVQMRNISIKIPLTYKVHSNSFVKKAFLHRYLQYYASTHFSKYCCILTKFYPIWLHYNKSAHSHQKERSFLMQCQEK